LFFYGEDYVFKPWHNVKRRGHIVFEASIIVGRAQHIVFKPSHIVSPLKSMSGGSVSIGIRLKYNVFTPKNAPDVAKRIRSTAVCSLNSCSTE